MSGIQSRLRRVCLFALCSLTAIVATAQSITIRGTVTDPSGAIVAGATVDLLRQQEIIASTTSDSQGQYRLAIAPEQSSALRISAPGFRGVLHPVATMPRFHDIVIDCQFELESLAQQITVTATGTPTPEARLGAAVTVLQSEDYQGTEDMQQGLRLVPGVQVTQTGQAGGVANLYIRGGGSDANKILIDGIPMNDIGGTVNFGNLATTGIGSAEILRGPNSVLYGPDALAGVISLNTARGSTPLPLLTYTVDGGNFNTYHEDGTLSGTLRHYDYFSEFSRFDTGNALPDNTFHNGTFAGNFGWMATKTTSLRATVHHDRVASGQPNALLLYGIPTEAKQANEDSYFGVTLENQTSATWHNLLRYGGTRLRSLYTEFAATGIPQYDVSGDLLDYLGAPVTIRGANGYSVSGQAFYQYVQPYPNFYPTSTDEDFVYAQSDKQLGAHVAGLVAFQYQNERGYSAAPESSVSRGNYNYTLQIQGDIRGRLFYTVGGGLEDNGLFGFAAVPRISLAYALRRPTDTGLLSGTKLRASFGEGIKEPSVGDQTTSLYALLQSLPNGGQLISQYHVGQIGAENSRTYDLGIDQDFLEGRAEASLTLFHNEFTHGIEFILQQGLSDLGVPAPIAAAAVDGATVNSQAYLAQGAEIDAKYEAKRLFARAGYTYLDARIRQSFSSDALGPSFNPDIPGVPIGAFGPLIGARPFRMAPHSGYFEFGYAHSRFSGSLKGTLVSRRDDSDFLSADANGELSLLLPNRNLDPAYQRLDAVLSYQATHHVKFESSFQNLLSQHYSEAFGYPALPFTFRSGVKFSFGGESWSIR